MHCNHGHVVAHTVIPSRFILAAEVIDSHIGTEASHAAELIGGTHIGCDMILFCSIIQSREALAVARMVESHAHIVVEIAVKDSDAALPLATESQVDKRLLVLVPVIVTSINRFRQSIRTNDEAIHATIVVELVEVHGGTCIQHTFAELMGQIESHHIVVKLLFLPFTIGGKG